MLGNLTFSQVFVVVKSAVLSLALRIRVSAELDRLVLKKFLDQRIISLLLFCFRFLVAAGVALVANRLVDKL